MQFLDGELYHVYNRGNVQRPIFFEERNYAYFLRKVKNELLSYSDILAYCLMPNHYHFLLTPKNGEDKEHHPLIRKLATLMSSYTRAINKVQDTSGSLFQQNTKVKHIEEFVYGLRCFHYIHRNPFEAGLEYTLGSWAYSSLPEYLNQRSGTLPNRTLAYELLDMRKDQSAFVEEMMHYKASDMDLKKYLV